jgi:hypothetical protein
MRLTAGDKLGPFFRAERTGRDEDQRGYKTGAAATAMAAAPQLFAQQSGKEGTAMSFYQNGPVRIHYESAAPAFRCC